MTNDNVPHRLDIKHSLSLLIDIEKKIGFDKESNVEEINKCISFLSNKGEFECYKFITHLEKNNIKNLTYDYFEKYLNSNYSPTAEKDNEFIDFSLIKLSIENKIQIKDFLNTIDKVGVYIFSEKEDLFNGNIFYVGFSTNLKSRILSSITERKLFDNNNSFYISVIDSFNTIDSFLLESYLINKLSPIMNKGGKYNQESSLITSISNFEISQIKCCLKYE